MDAHAPVTVVIPAYNNAEYIVQADTSALDQVPPPREVIVVDDGSPDDTAARVAPLAREGRIRYVRQPNAGMAAARRAGAALATSAYLYFLDDDDLLLPGTLARLVAELERHPAAAFAYGDMVIFRDEPAVPPPWEGPSYAVNRTEFLLFNQIGSPGQVLIRRSAYEAVSGFDATIWGTDDWDLWLRLLARFPARMVPRPVMLYRTHADNASRNIAQMYRSSLRVARRHLRGMPAERRPALRRFSYARLRDYHVPRLAERARADARAGVWARAASAASAWLLAWVTDLGARVALKASLLARGRWYPTSEEELIRADDR